jgi:hypothetical protein
MEDGTSEVKARVAHGKYVDMKGWKLSIDLGYHYSEWHRRA